MSRILLLTFIVILLSVGFFGSTPTVDQRSIGNFVLETTQFFKDDPVEMLTFDTVRFVGDVMLARKVEYMMDTYGNDYPFLQLPPLATSSILVGNFEASIPKIHVKTPDFTLAFSVNPLYLKGLSDYGFTQLSLANNHSYDFGEDAFINTGEELIKASLTPFGTPNDFATSTVSYIEVSGEIVGLLGINALEKLDRVLLTDTVRYMSTKSDLQVAYLHWGTEYQLKHNSAQEELAYQLIDSGIDVVIGNHPHVVQDIELYKGVPIFYSLGNFIFDQYFSKDVQEGLMVDMKIATSTIAFQLIPITSIGSQSSPRLMGVHEKNLFMSSLKKRSSSELSKMIEEEVIVVKRQ